MGQYESLSWDDAEILAADLLERFGTIALVEQFLDNIERISQEIHEGLRGKKDGS